MTCPSCQAENPPGLAACLQCGQPLGTPPESAGGDDRWSESDPEATRWQPIPPRSPATPLPSPPPSPPPSPAPSPVPGSGSADRSPGSPAGSGARSAAALAVVQPGADLGWRYHVESALGEGGMGSVYKAYDRELDRHVAIKIIRPGLVADSGTLQRFKQELLLGSKISHRNILRIHDLGDLDGLKYISMAYVDGEDLHRILRREGRLEISRSLRIARQIAGALAAAHAEGVVHRDFKPHNILVDRTDTPYVSDFGLAKSLQSASAGMTRSGELLGTPRYMAPEQVEGGQVDHRVDIYAFGLILYEMVTGASPFHGESAIQELLQRVRVNPPDPRSVNANVPAPLADVILRCLERNPADRYQTAEEVLAALDQADPDVGSMRRRGSLPSGRTTWISSRVRRRRRLVAIVAGVLVLAAGGGLVMRWWLQQRAPANDRSASSAAPGASDVTPQPAGRQLAVLPFRVLGSEEQLRYIADGVVEALSAKLFQVAQLRVASGRDVAQAGAYDTIEEAGRKLGASLIVEGTVQSAGDRLRLVVNLHDVPAKRRVWSQQFTGLKDDLFRLEDDIYRQLVDALSLPADAVLLAGTITRPTGSIEAYDLYLKGRNALRSERGAEEVQEAIRFFEQALKKDPGFALAHAGMADASLLMYRERKDSFWAERAQAAAQRAVDLNDRLPEVQFSLGSVYTGTGRHAEAASVLKRALELAPNSAEAYRRLGAAYAVVGRKEDAIRELEKAVEINPYFWLNHNELGAAYVKFGESDKALEAFRRVTELEPENPAGFENIGSVLFTQGRWEECIPAYQKALSMQPYWLTYSNLGTAYFFLKRYEEAVEAFRQAVALHSTDAITMGNLADALRWSGRRDEARATYTKAIALAYRELQVNPRDATMLGLLALYYAKNEDFDRAAEAIRRARAVDRRSAALIYYQAVVESLGGREAQALVTLEQALAAGYPVREAANDPELGGLAGKPAFEQILRRFTDRPT